MSEPIMEPTAGEAVRPEVPDFDLLRPIGEGAFGQVWLAVNRTTGRLRAVKLVPLRGTGPFHPADREIGSLGHLESRLGDQHPNLMTIHHVGKTGEFLFYVMDLADDVSGGPGSRDPAYRPATLQSCLESGPLPAGECLVRAKELLSGLAALHAAGMVHRDVKPANCLLAGGRLQLADFGLVTEPGLNVSRVGTRPYMPPDGRMDARADVYAAGMVIYQMLTGLPAESFPRLGPRADEIGRNGDLRKLNRIVLRACQPLPADRYEDAQEMLAALEAEPPKPRRRKRALLTGLAGLVVAAVALAAVWSSRPGQRVSVNFVTEPYYNAAISLDGELLSDPAGIPYATPCTVPDLLARTYRVEFQHKTAGRLNAGRVDFARVRDLVARWPPGDPPLSSPEQPAR